MKKLILFAFLSTLMVEQVRAECNAAADPCAPKKTLDAFTYSGTLGSNFTNGNSKTSLLNLGLGVNRETAQDIIALSAAYNFGQNRNNVDQQTTQNDFRAAGSYNYILDDRFYAGMGSKVLHDEIADINYRAILDPTLGFYAIKDDTFKLRLEGGPSYVFEEVANEKNDYFAPRLGDRFDWIMSCSAKVYQSADVYFDTSDSDNYLVNAEVGVEAAINTLLSLVVKVRDTYDNTPAPDLEKNDVAVITGIKVTL